MFEGMEKSAEKRIAAGPHPRLIRLAREVGAYPAEPPDDDAKLEHTQPGLYVRRPGPVARLWSAIKGLLRPTASA